MYSKARQMQDYPQNFLNRLDEIIAANLQNSNFSIAYLCREITISYTHIYRKIRAETGLSPSMYVNKKRLEKAVYLLEYSELNMEEIACQVGFNTPTYFSKCFSDQYADTPLQYRKKAKKERKFLELKNDFMR